MKTFKEALVDFLNEKKSYEDRQDEKERDKKRKEDRSLKMKKREEVDEQYILEEEEDFDEAQENLGHYLTKNGWKRKDHSDSSGGYGESFHKEHNGNHHYIEHVTDNVSHVINNGKYKFDDEDNHPSLKNWHPDNTKNLVKDVHNYLTKKHKMNHSM